MNHGTVDIFSEITSDLGECPLWDNEEGALFWIDSLSGLLFRADRDGSLHSWKAPQEIGSFALCQSGGALCALRDGLYRLDFETGSFALLKRTPNDPQITRLNDGKCDRRGRFWIGSLTEGDDRVDAVLYRFNLDGSLVETLDGIRVSNGLAFPAGEDFFYHSDSRVGRIDRVSPSRSEEGGLTRELFFQTDKEVERPDGAAVDEQGYYWSALYGGGAIIRISPSGEEVFRMKLPTAYPTMIAFGGPCLKTLFITTDSSTTMTASTENDPYAGKVLTVEVDIAGLPEPRFAL